MIPDADLADIVQGGGLVQQVNGFLVEPFAVSGVQGQLLGQYPDVFPGALDMPSRLGIACFRQGRKAQNGRVLGLNELYVSQQQFAFFQCVFEQIISKLEKSL